MSSVWVTKRPGKRGMRYLVRWIEPDSRRNRAKTFGRSEDARDFRTKLMQDLRNNEYFIPVNVNFDEWVKRRLHNLRKTWNTTMQDKGIPQEVAMQVLGHTSAHVNRQFYAGMLTEQQRIAVSSLPSVG